MKRKDRTAEKRQPIPSGSAGTAPRRRAFRFGFPRCLFSWRVLVAAAHQRRRSRIKDKHTPRLQKLFITYCLALPDDFGIGNYFDLRRGIGLRLMLKYVKII